MSQCCPVQCRHSVSAWSVICRRSVRNRTVRLRSFEHQGRSADLIRKLNDASRSKPLRSPPQAYDIQQKGFDTPLPALVPRHSTPSPCPSTLHSQPSSSDTPLRSRPYVFPRPPTLHCQPSSPVTAPPEVTRLSSGLGGPIGRRGAVGGAPGRSALKSVVRSVDSEQRRATGPQRHLAARPAARSARSSVRWMSMVVVNTPRATTREVEL